MLSHRQALAARQLQRHTAARKALHVTCFIPNSNKQQQVKVTTRACSSPPPQLIKEEQASLTTARKAAGLSDDDNPATNLSAPAVRQVLDTIKRGLDKQEEDLPKLEGAMLLAEQLFHASGGSGSRFAAAGAAEASPQSVDMWQPIFASAGGFPRLLYIPVPEYFDMHKSLPNATAISISSVTESIDATSSPVRAAAAAGPAAGSLNIITELGPLTTHFLGTCAWLDSTTFQYSINSIRLDVGGRSFTFGMGPFKLENELSFFLTTPELACARSKLGGTMLLAAEPAKGKAYSGAW